MKRSYRYSHFLILAGALAPFSSVPAQPALSSASAQTRTQAIAASFTKSKHVVKEKRGVRIEKYKRDGALLTATQVYANGTQNRFEGAFMNRTSFDSPADKGFTTFGLGVIGKEIVLGGNTINRFFYESNK